MSETKNHKIRYVLFCMAAAVMILFSTTVMAASAEEGTYYIYYKNPEGTSLVPRAYQVKGETFDDILRELATQFMNAPQDTVASALPQGVSINSYTRGVDNLTVDLGSGFLGMSNTDQVLLEAAIVKTLIQMPGVVKIYLSVEGQELKNAAGTPVGPLDEESFITSDGKGIDYLRQIRMPIYFSAGDGQSLVMEDRTFQYTRDSSTERLLVEALLDGSRSNHLSIAVPETTVLNVTVRNKVCMIDLSAQFNEKVEGVSPLISLYAFVYSIIENCDVDGVRFFIDGQNDMLFRGEVDISQVFTENQEIVTGTDKLGIDPALLEAETQAAGR